MKRFRFSLDALLEMRKREEDAVKLALGRKNQEIHQAQGELQDLEKQLKQLQEQQHRTRETVTDVLPLRYSVSYRNKLKTDMLRKGEEIFTLQNQRGDIRKRLVRATQRRRAIELIKEKRYREWLKENKLREQVFIDDVSQQGFIRRRRKAQKPSVA
jgi:flagellar FliJ protein